MKTLPIINPLTIIELAQLTAKQLNKPILYLSNLFEDHIDSPDMDIDSLGRLLAAPFISTHLHTEVWSSSLCFIVCESDDEMMELYDLVYGDDGMTPDSTRVREKYGYQPYDGEHRIYALTIHADGSLGAENT